MSTTIQPVFYTVQERPGFLDGLKNDVKRQAGKDHDILLERPVIYIHVWQSAEDAADNKWSIYIGESINLMERTREHYRKAAEPLTWQHRMVTEKDEKGNPVVPVMYVFGHKHFSMSMTRDIENRLISYCLANPHANPQNGRGNPQRDYYGMEDTDDIFHMIWSRLRRENGELFPAESRITKSAIYKASPNHRLTPEQEEAKEKIKDRVADAVIHDKTGQLIFVEGEAGTGKTVLTSSTFYELLDSDAVRGRNLKCHLLVNHDEQLSVYKNMAARLGYKDDVVLNPTTFLNSHSVEDKATGRKMPDPQKKADVVFVDEAHLLWTQPKQSYSKKYSGRQLDDIMDRARVTVIMFDENQILRKEQFDDLKFMEKKRQMAKEQGPDPANPDPAQVRNNYILLKNQMRMNCGAGTMRWIDSLTQKLKVDRLKLDGKNRDEKGYEVVIFDDPASLHAAVKEKAKKAGSELSRLTATYDWKYKNREWAPPKQKYWRVKIGDWQLPWNEQHYWLDIRFGLNRREIRKKEALNWAEQEYSIDEVGSTFTIQGFDLAYAGVILGPSVRYDPDTDRIWFDEEKRAWDHMKGNRKLLDGTIVNVTDTISRHEMRVLLTRGTGGLYLYACDKELRKALKNAVEG